MKPYDIPKPQYDYKTRVLTQTYKQAALDIKQELNRLDVTDLRQAHAQGALKNIGRVLQDTNKNSAKWVRDNIPEAAKDGVERSLVATGVAGSFEEAAEIVKFNRANEAMVAATIADTQDDLLQITQNMDRRTKTAIRKAVSESQRAEVARGVTGVRALSKDKLQRIRKILDDSVDRGIIDAAGKRWKPETYAEMVTRTKMREAHTEATVNEALDRGALYGIISSHSAIDPCSYHEGRIVKLDPDAPGDMPTIDDLRATDHIFHPNCMHVVTPTRRPDLLPEDAKQRAREQDEKGRKAVATGKRYPAEKDFTETNVTKRDIFGTDTTPEFEPQNTVKEAKEWAEKNDLADNVNYKDMKVEVANEMNRSVFNHYKRLPQLREEVNTIGTAQARNNLIYEGQLNYLVKKYTARGYTHERALKIAKGQAKKMQVNKREFASALRRTQRITDQIGVKPEGIAVNKHFGNNPKLFNTELAKSVETKFHPPGCGTIKATFDHEMGHVLDYRLGISDDPRIVKKYRELKTTQLMEEKLSKYGEENTKEFVAEAWAEYLNNPQPREVAKEVGGIIEEAINKAKEVN